MVSKVLGSFLTHTERIRDLCRRFEAFRGIGVMCKLRCSPRAFRMGCSARSRRPASLPSSLPPCGHSAGHAIRAQRRRRPSQCSPFHSQFSLPLGLRIWQSMSFLASPALSLSLCHVAGRRRWPCLSLSLFAVIHPCTANSACMNYEMKGGTKAIFRSPDSGRRWSLARSTAGDQWSVGLTAGAGQ